MLYESTVKVPVVEIRPSESSCPIMSAPLTGINRRGLGEGAGMTREVNIVLGCPTGNLVSASTTTHSNFKTWPISSAVGVYVLNRPTSNQVSPPLLCVTAAGYKGVEPLIWLEFDVEPDKLVLRTADPVLLKRPNSSSSSFPFSFTALAARSCKTRWCCHASEKHLGEQW